ncbi:MAG TPA: protein-L-isoaspartate(D-aspartate) O-methyltransferase [Terriglobia bacterium]|nr:protein-L-isoaspartate(D-aspartate) O-methyltransferase [Terriglobia bacterium]
MEDTTTPRETERQAMVKDQLRARGIRNERVLEAMATVPRHEFVPVDQAVAAYEDRALPIGPWETISQPYIVALMSDAAAVGPGDRVLEVGTGLGYQAAVLAALGARVYTVERNAALAEEARRTLARLGYGHAVEVITGDGTEGYPAAAPYDAIVVTAGAPRVPPALVDQLAEGGRLVIPTGGRQMQQLHLLVRAGGEVIDKTLDACQFVPLVGKQGWPQARWPRFFG